ncbi:unnamed protein product [Symbiodinium pilosum]|uniref:Uncharacterized protein n=1 Tax=Symbiodinium pilosum TaxID=2952 RepID=A0A812IM99_SYMPI|nr:unnamed protein product [Symbiodinium pilosum]
MKALVAVLQRPRPKVGRLRGACHQGIPPYFAILRHPLPSASRLQVQAPAVGGSSCEPERLHGPGPIAGQAVQKGGLSRLACSTRVAHVQPVMMCRYARPNRPRPGLSPGRPPQPPRRRRRRIEARSDSEVEAKRARNGRGLRGQSAEPPLANHASPKKAERKRATPRAARAAPRAARAREPSERECSDEDRSDASSKSRKDLVSGRDRQRKAEYMQMAAQQAAFMQFMHHPGYMAMMQQQMGMMQPHMMHMGMRPQPWGPARRGRRSSSSGSYSSSESRKEGAQPDSSCTLAAHSGKEVEEFLKAATELEAEVANRFRDMPPHLQQEVMRRGPLDARSPTSSLLSRMKQALEADRSGCLLRGGGPGNGGMRPVKQSAKAAIEALINDFHLQPECAWMLRSLPPDKQKLAARIDPSGQADASGYVAEELKKIV